MSNALRQLSAETGIPLPRLRRDLSNEGRHLLAAGLANAVTNALPPPQKFKVGDYVMAPYDGELFLAEIVRITNENAKIFFVDYDEFAQRSLDALVLTTEEYNVGVVHNNTTAAQGDFLPSMRTGGGGSGSSSGAGSIYSAKHIRAQAERAANGAAKPAKRGPISRKISKR